MSQAIIDALSKLDPTNDNHWTQDGMPRLDAVQALSGVAVKREQITILLPAFSRHNNAPLAALLGTGTTTAPNAPQAPAPALQPWQTGNQAPVLAAPQAPIETQTFGELLPQGEAIVSGENVTGEGFLQEGVQLVGTEFTPEQVAAMGLENLIQIAKDELAEAEAAYTEAQAFKRDKEVALDKLLDEQSKQAPTQGFTTVNQEFLNSQKRQREERAAIRGQILASGVDVRLLAQATDIRSPLDRAIAGQRR